MASEDSQDFGWLAMVHRLCDLGDGHQSFDGQVTAELHKPKYLGELGEVVSLRRSQGVRLVERNDHVVQLTEAVHAVPEDILPVIVMTGVSVDLAASEEADQVLQHVATRGALDDGKFRSNLPAKPHRWTAPDGNAETAFTIREPHDPSEGREPFLLVFRTAHIVTAGHQPQS